jgi:hypothetical protein
MPRQAANLDQAVHAENESAASHTIRAASECARAVNVGTQLALRSTSDAFTPPKPNEFDMMWSTCAGRPARGM